MIIGIAGAAGAGKDTVADILVRNYGFRKYNFALPIKQGLNTMFGWTMEQWDDRVWKEAVQPAIGKSPRQLAQTLGTEWGRDLVHPELWLILARRAYEAADTHFVIPDVRFTNEAQFLRAAGGEVWKIERPGCAAIAAHVSESGIPTALVDRVLDNTSTMSVLHALVDCAVRGATNTAGVVGR